MTSKRQILEGAIERLIDILDKMDGDPDFEQEPPEEQYDIEADMTWNSDAVPVFYVIAERARRKATSRR